MHIVSFGRDRQMMRGRWFVCGAGIVVLLTAADVAADRRVDSPTSLRMRIRPRPHVAQAGPDPQPAGDTPPAGDAPPPAPAPDPVAPIAVEPAPAGSAPALAAPPAGPEVPVPDRVAAAAANPTEGTARVEARAVTGSPIERADAGELSPITIIDRERLTGAGLTNLGSILQQITAQGNAPNAQNNVGGDGSTRINLRSLGTRRTLVLLNGRRMVAGGLGADDSVDLGAIPLAIVERVEVLKDGAAAIYGSDAIAGVVNIITRAHVSGTEATVYTSTSQRGDGTNYDLGFVTGGTSARGNFLFSAGYQRQSPVMAADRPFSAQIATYNYKCSAAAMVAGNCVVGGTTVTGSPASPTGYIDTLSDDGKSITFTPPLSTRSARPTRAARGSFAAS